MLIKGEELLALIPQRKPIVMIDSLLYADGSRTETRLFLTESNIFCEDGCFTEPGLIENIAQTAAAGTGWSCRQENKGIPVGFIGAVKNLQINFLPKIGTEIHTIVNLEHSVMKAAVITGKVMSGGDIAAQCEMKVFFL